MERQRMEAVGHNPQALKQQRGRAQKRGFNLSSSSSNAVGQPCKGFSLVEAAIVLGVVGLVIGGIWVAAAKVNDSIKWRQTEEGWIYYMNLTAKYFNQTTWAGQPQTDIEPFWIQFPLPAGWSVGGPWGRHPVDPYGGPLYGQVQPDGITSFFGYPWPHPQCVKIQRMIRLRMDSIYKITYTNIPYACVNDIGACCPGGTGNATAAYFTMPRR